MAYIRYKFSETDNKKQNLGLNNFEEKKNEVVIFLLKIAI